MPHSRTVDHSLAGLFSEPQAYRENILGSFLGPECEWVGHNHVVVFPTKFCPVGCAHCYFASPKPSKSVRPIDTVLGEDDIHVALRFVNEANTELLQITGGGEPLLELPSVLRVIRNSHSRLVDLNTSGVTLTSAGKATEVIEALFDAFRGRPCAGSFYFRLSVDQFHLEKLGIKPATTVISVFRQNHERYSKERFVLRLKTLFEDDSVAQLIRQMANDIREVTYEQVSRYNLPVRAHFNSGGSFEVIYTPRMLTNPMPRMSEREEIERSAQRFDVIRMPNPGLWIDSDGRKGLCLVIHEDGNVDLWNTTPKDTVRNVRTCSFREVKRSILTDVIQVAALEKTLLYVDSILEEVNPLALRRAKAIGSATFYSQRTFSEARDRLYVSIRLLQDYVAEGETGRIDMQSLDPAIEAAMRLSKEELQSLYFESNHDVVEEYLCDPKVTAHKLFELRRQLALGHFSVTPQSMLERVNESTRLSGELKAQFRTLVAKNGDNE